MRGYYRVLPCAFFRAIRRTHGAWAVSPSCRPPESVTLIHTLFTADSQQFAEDSQGFARIHAVVSRNTRPIRTIRAPFAPHSRGFAPAPQAVRADSRPVRADSRIHREPCTSIRGHSRSFTGPDHLTILGPTSFGPTHTGNRHSMDNCLNL